MLSRVLAWLFGYVVPGFILIGGFGGLWISGGYLVDAYSSAAWPYTTGTVVRSELGSESDLRRSADRTRYWPEVEYRYEVDGETFQSNDIRLDGLRSGAHLGAGKAQAEEVLSRYPVGTQVRVYYNPNLPGRAALQTGVSPRNFFVPIFAFVLTVLGAGWLWLMLFPRAGRSGDDKHWSGRQRTCPECQTTFRSVQDKGSCPQCHHVFFASEV